MKRKLAIGILLTMVVLTISAGGNTEREIYTIGEGTSLAISSDVPEVTIRKGTRKNRMVVELDALQRDYHLTVSESNDAIAVQVKKRDRFALSPLSLKQPRLIITLPEDHQLNEMAIASVSGAVESEVDIRADRISIDSVSAAISFPKLSGKTAIALNTVSGAVSGDIISSADITINTISGKIQLNTIDATDGSFQLVSVSGSCSTHQLSAQDAYLQSISGAINIALAPSFSGIIETATISGATHIDVPQAQMISKQDKSQKLLLGSHNQQLTLTTTSGAIRLTQ
jgi:DUF4097 and DUF4098 domain-containing protein YvlB